MYWENHLEKKSDQNIEKSNNPVSARPKSSLQFHFKKCEQILKSIEEIIPETTRNKTKEPIQKLHSLGI